MLWPLLVEYTEPGVPATSHIQQQGNMALFLTLFIVTCVEVLIVKVAQSERELEMMLTPHDPPYLSEYAEDDDEDDDICRVRTSLYEEELRRQKRFLINKSYLAAAGVSDFPDTKTKENGFGSTPNGKNLQETLEESFQGNVDSTENWSEHHADIKPSEKDPNADMVRVREVMEKMIEKMIGGPLDGTTVGQLSSHPAYLDMFTKYHNLLCRDLARLGFALHLSVVRNIPFELDPTDSRQSNLKRLIKRIIAEAMALPNINDILLSPKISKESGIEDFKNKSYEDILSTAILNKIIGNYQNKNYKENEATDGNPKPRLRNRKIRRKDNSESRSDDDWSDTSRSDQLSLTIEEYIEEVTTTLEVSDDEKSDLSDFETTSNRRIPFPESGRTVIDAGTDDENSDLEDQNTATELITSGSSWEENWLFQKKRLRSTPNAHHPVPVPMLVPNPSEDFRALVGGVDADDLSDMSDCADSVLEDFTTTENLSMKTQNAEAPLINDSEEGDTKQTEAVEESLCDKDQEEIVEVNIPAKEAEDTNCEDAFKEVEEFGTQEMCKEAEDDLFSPTSPDALSQKDRESSFQDFSHQYEEPVNSHSASEGEIQTSNCTETITEDTTTRCPLAEREKEKWNNPVSLAENPYSPENIERREQRKKNEYFRIGTYLGESVDFPEDFSSDELFPPKKEAEKLRFSRDYYVNASKHPSGMSSPCNTPEDHVKVSRHSYEAISSLGRRTLEKNSKPSLYHDIADGSAKYFTPHHQFKNIFPPLQSQTIRRQHFSEVFKTTNALNDEPPKPKALRKYRYGSNTLKLRPKVRETTFRKPSFHQELSDFEQKSLREDLKHSLLRAKGASPNFILNPVFTPEAVTKSSKMEPKTGPFAAAVSRGRAQEELTKDESGSESGFGKSEPITPLYRHSSGENTSRAYKNKPAIKVKTVNSLENHKLLTGKMTEVKSNEYHNLRIVNKKEFCLPSVKELAKQFTVEDCRDSKPPNFNSQNKLQSKTKNQNLPTKEFSEKEFEVDYSTVPVSEIISNLQHAAEAPAKVNHNKELYSHTQPNTQMEVCRTEDDNVVIEKSQESGKKAPKVEAFRFNGKEVHSLTARSISKEFREGLKNNSYHRVYPKVDRISSGGESDQEVSNLKSSPTPSIDLKNMKKFWEEIITGNSTIQNKNKI